MNDYHKVVRVVCGDKVYAYYYNHHNKIIRIVMEK